MPVYPSNVAGVWLSTRYKVVAVKPIPVLKVAALVPVVGELLFEKFISTNRLLVPFQVKGDENVNTFWPVFGV